MAAPAAGSKYDKLIEPFAASLETAKTLMDKAHNEFVDFEATVRTEKEEENKDVGHLRAIPAVVLAYRRALAINSQLCRLFLATEVIDCTLDVAESPSTAKTASSPSKAGEGSAPKSSPSKSPSKLQKEDENEDPHPSSDKVTLHMVSSLK